MFFACSSPKEEVAPIDDQPPQEVIEEEVKDDDGVFYQVPTPNELFSVIKNSKIDYNNEILNDVSNIDKYNSKSAKALNFGVFAADLAYISSLGHIEDISPVFETLRNLSKELEIENALDEAIYQRIQSNMDNSNADSLFYLSNETYYNAYSYLEQSDRGGVLGMIVIGGWIEGLNILLNLAPFEEGSELSERIADQRLTLENLLIFTSRIDNPDLDMVVSELEPIDEVFMTLEEVESKEELTTSKGDDGVVVFGGGSTVSISNEQYNQLKSVVNELRNSIVDVAL